MHAMKSSTSVSKELNAIIAIFQQPLEESEPAAKMFPEGYFGLRKDVAILIGQAGSPFPERNFAGSSKVLLSSLGKIFQNMAFSGI